jgi:hypothetical protein
MRGKMFVLMIDDTSVAATFAVDFDEHGMALYTSAAAAATDGGPV